MLDFNDLIKILKKSSLDAFEASKPCHVVFGTVTSESPLKVNVEQKMTLTSAQLIIPRSLTNYTVMIDIDDATEIGAGHIDLTHKHSFSGDTGSYNSHSHSFSGETENGGGIDISHTHKFKGRKEITIRNALKINDEVIMIRVQGGQKYLIVDKVVK